MAILDLHYVDELIGARRDQHGGERGAPNLVQPGVRQGASINRSCIVMLSAQLQDYIEQVFVDCAKIALPSLCNQRAFGRFMNQVGRWGNPNPNNVRNLFHRIGVYDVLDGLHWQRFTNENVCSRLDALNQIRNDIAHGQRQLSVNGERYSLSLPKAVAFRNFARNFGDRFEAHALNKAQREED